MIDASGQMGLLEYVEFYQELEKEFGCHVDVVTSGIDDKEFYMQHNDKNIVIVKK